MTFTTLIITSLLLSLASYLATSNGHSGVGMFLAFIAMSLSMFSLGMLGVSWYLFHMKDKS